MAGMSREGLVLERTAKSPAPSHRVLMGSPALRVPPSFPIREVIKLIALNQGLYFICIIPIIWGLSTIAVNYTNHRKTSLN